MFAVLEESPGHSRFLNGKKITYSWLQTWLIQSLFTQGDHMTCPILGLVVERLVYFKLFPFARETQSRSKAEGRGSHESLLRRKSKCQFQNVRRSVLSHPGSLGGRGPRCHPRRHRVQSQGLHETLPQNNKNNTIW